MPEFMKRYTPEAQERLRRHLTATIKHLIETLPPGTHRLDTLAGGLGNGIAPLFQKIYILNEQDSVGAQWNELGKKSLSMFVTKYINMELPEGFQDVSKPKS